MTHQTKCCIPFVTISPSPIVPTCPVITSATFDGTTLTITGSNFDTKNANIVYTGISGGESAAIRVTPTDRNVTTLTPTLIEITEDLDFTSIAFVSVSNCCAALSGVANP